MGEGWGLRVKAKRDSERKVLTTPMDLASNFPLIPPPTPMSTESQRVYN